MRWWVADGFGEARRARKEARMQVLAFCAWHAVSMYHHRNAMRSQPGVVLVWTCGSLWVGRVYRVPKLLDGTRWANDHAPELVWEGLVLEL
eukprot:15467482-Alexandrium_andersonii.AAC.1